MFLTPLGERRFVSRASKLGQVPGGNKWATFDNIFLVTAVLKLSLCSFPGGVQNPLFPGPIYDKCILLPTINF